MTYRVLFSTWVRIAYNITSLQTPVSYSFLVFRLLTVISPSSGSNRMIPRRIIRKRLHFRSSLQNSAAPLPYFTPKFIGAKFPLPGLLKNKFIFQNSSVVPISTAERETCISYRCFNTANHVLHLTLAKRLFQEIFNWYWKSVSSK
jgi:hypothetical protein